MGQSNLPNRDSDPAEPDAADFGQPSRDALNSTFVQPGRRRSFWLRVSIFWERIAARLSALFEEEVQRGGPFLWVPVVFGIGILIYFSLPREPFALAFPTMAVLAGLLAWRSARFGFWYRSAAILALLAAGAAAAQFQVWRLDTAMQGRSFVAQVDGRIERVEQRANGSARYTLLMDKGAGSLVAKGLERTPRRIRLTARKAVLDAKVGDRLTGRARLGPPPGPSMVGGYDFAFQAWFEGRGASGFFLGQPRHSAALAPVRSLAGLRDDIGAIIRQAVPGEGGAIATALILGDRSGISEETSEALRRSGLAHILAISGLHMSLVVATLLFGMRFVLAVMPGLVLNFPIKKWAAAAGLLAATFYLGLSGGSVSARRAFIMVAIMLIAILLDRRALTMRNVAVAAMIVLALSPHAILSPGFQMSFAAVAALVATYEMTRGFRQNGWSKNGAGGHGRLLRKFARGTGGLALTSLVAGLATAFFAAFHFYRVAPLGLLANLLAMPLVTFIVMPLALVSMLAMPFGLEQTPLRMMEWGTGMVVEVAKWVAAIGPDGGVGQVASATLALVTLALLLVTLCRTALRWGAVVPAILALILPIEIRPPDILISGTGKQVALMTGEGVQHLLRPRAERFTTTIWQNAFGKAASRAASHTDTPTDNTAVGFACDSYGCVATHLGKVIVAVKTGARLWEDCAMADIIILPFFQPNACGGTKNGKPLVLGASEFEAHGAHSLIIDEKGRIVTKTARPGLNRPWTAGFQRK